MPTLTACWQALGYRIGGFGVYTTDGTGAVDGSTLVCEDAFGSTAPPTGVLPDSHLANAWVYVPLGAFPRQRRVNRAGLTVTTGAITVDRPFGQQIASGVQFAVSRYLPIYGSGSTGMGETLHGCVNASLRHQLLPREFEVAIVAGADEYTGLPAWLNRATRLIAVKEPAPVSGRSPILSPRGWELIQDGETPRLRCRMPIVSAAGGSVLTISTVQPADTWISTSGGSYAEDANGLTNETDVTPLELEDVVVGALPFAYLAIAQARDGAQHEEYLGRYATSLDAARGLPYWDRSRDRLPAPSEVRPGTEAA